jgi:transmembrane sensor
MQEDRFWLLISLRLSGEATAEELAELEGLLQLYPERGLKLEMLYQLWETRQEDTEPVDNGRRDRHWQRLSSRTSRRRVWLTVTIAASLLIAFLYFYPAIPGKQGPVAATNTVSTRPGSKSKIQLPDGSQVWLNADSRMTYDEHFSGVSREVRLSGEAYFDVVKDKDHPFIIHTSSIDVKVLGTRLNVRAYCLEKNTEALLIQGSVEVSLRDHPDKKIILKPNDKIIVPNEKKALATDTAGAKGRREKPEPVISMSRAHYLQRDSLATEILWTNNKLAFDGEPLEEVASKIERWYDVRLIIRYERLRRLLFTGVFEDESLNQVMEALRLSGGFHYTINRKEVIITP